MQATTAILLETLAQESMRFYNFHTDLLILMPICSKGISNHEVVVVIVAHQYRITNIICHENTMNSK